MENTNDEIIIKNKKINRKLIIIYKMLSYDLLFFYTISYLFFVNEKGLTASQIVFGEAFYPLFKIIFQIPCTFLIQRLGKKKSLIIANTSLVIYMLIIIHLTNIFSLIIANLFCAIGYVIKGMSESTLLFDSIDNSENKHEIFSKYEGKANGAYYFFDAVTALLTGYFFAYNPYLPLYLSLSILVISVFITFQFKEIKKVDKIQKNSLIIDVKNYFSDIKISLKFISRSNRLKSLIIYDATVIALLTATVTLRTSLLNELHVSSESLGIIFSILGLISCYSSSKALSIHKKYKNKTLSIIGLSFTFSLFLCALAVILNISSFFMYYTILIMFSIQYFCKGTFQTIIKQYLNSFCDSKMRLKIYSTTALTESLTTTILSIVCSKLLNFLLPSQTILIIGTSFTIIMIFISIYMSSRLGLKPEDYPEKDISYIDLI